MGISATLLSGRLASASPVVGNLVELDAIAAVVIGGTALAGGKATVTGTFFGVITFALIFNLLNLLNMPAEIKGSSRACLSSPPSRSNVATSSPNRSGRKEGRAEALPDPRPLGRDRGSRADRLPTRPPTVAAKALPGATPHRPAASPAAPSRSPSAPGADHGGVKAITDNARKEADELGVDLILSEGTNDSASQVSQVETLISQKPDVLVILFQRAGAHPDRAAGHAGRDPGCQRRP